METPQELFDKTTNYVAGLDPEIREQPVVVENAVRSVLGWLTDTEPASNMAREIRLRKPTPGSTGLELEDFE